MQSRVNLEAETGLHGLGWKWETGGLCSLGYKYRTQ